MRSEFTRHWPIVLVAGVGVACGSSPIPFFALGVFTKAWVTEFGWTRGQTALLMTFFTYGSVLGSPIAGILLDRWGVRRVGVAALLALAAGLALISNFSDPLYAFYGIAFGAAFFASGSLPGTWSRAVMERFDAKRGLALGLALTGTGLSAVILPQYATWLMERFDWRVAFLGIAALPGLIAAPVVWLFLPKESSAQVESVQAAEGMPLRVAAGAYRFWVIAASFVLVSLGVGGLITHMIPMLTDRGYSPGEAAAVASVQGLALIAGRVVTGYLLDRLWAPGLTAFILAFPAFACLIFATEIGGTTGAAAAAAIMGFAAGAEIDLLAFLIGRYFGMKHFGAIYGVLYAAFIIGAGSAPALFGYAYDVSGSYAFILKVAAACFTAGAVLILTMGRYPTLSRTPGAPG